MANRFYRGTTELVIAGVYGGIGRWLGIDPVLLRLFFGLGIWSAIGVFVHPLLSVIAPREGTRDNAIRYSGLEAPVEPEISPEWRKQPTTLSLTTGFIPCLRVYPCLTTTYWRL